MKKGWENFLTKKEKKGGQQDSGKSVPLDAQPAVQSKASSGPWVVIIRKKEKKWKKKEEARNPRGGVKGKKEKKKMGE